MIGVLLVWACTSCTILTHAALEKDSYIRRHVIDINILWSLPNRSLYESLSFIFDLSIQIPVKARYFAKYKQLETY